MVDFKELSKSVERNVELHKQAKEYKQLIDSDLNAAVLQLKKGPSLLTDRDKAKFWDFLFEEVVGRPNAQTSDFLEAMSYDEAMKWAQKTKVGFGKYELRTIRLTPISYFEWLEGQPDLRRQLRRYMGSSYYREVHCKDTGLED